MIDLEKKSGWWQCYPEGEEIEVNRSCMNSYQLITQAYGLKLVGHFLDHFLIWS